MCLILPISCEVFKGRDSRLYFFLEQMLDKLVMRYLCRCVKLGKGGKQVENSKKRDLWIQIWGKAVPEFSGFT